MRGTRFVGLLGGGALALSLGCGGAASQIESPRAEVAPADSNAVADATDYAAALREAFEGYEAEIEYALSLTFASPEEARAVARSLAPERFDNLLEVALTRRGLNVDALGTYAQQNPVFFAEQQARYDGRLGHLERRALRVTERIQPGMDTVAFAEPAE